MMVSVMLRMKLEDLFFDVKVKAQSINISRLWFLTQHTKQGLYIGYDSISVLSQSVSLLQVYLLLELSSSSLLAGTGGNRRRPAATSPLVFSVVRLTKTNKSMKVKQLLDNFLITVLDTTITSKDMTDKEASNLKFKSSMFTLDMSDIYYKQFCPQRRKYSCFHNESK